MKVKDKINEMVNMANEVDNIFGDGIGEFVLTSALLRYLEINDIKVVTIDGKPASSWARIKREKK